jgi:tetratricopeptide (TPR) repeat protein/energy-coupling factor transporter ATP-binding protein EcfA2
MGGRDESVLDLVRRRWSVLEPLLEGPTYKRDLVAAVDRSRSTVDRAVRELEAAGLAERVDGGYVASVAGQLAADRYREAADSLGAVEAATAALEPLPHDAAVAPALLTDATVTVAGGSESAAPGEDGSAPPTLVDRFVERVANAEGARVALADGAIGGERMADRCRGAVDGGTVLLPSGEEEDGENPEYRVVAGEAPSFSLARTVDPDGVAVLVHAPDGSPHALVGTDAAAALAWADERLDGLDPAREVPDAGGGDRAPTTVALASEGFQRLDTDHFERRRPRDPVTALRTGHDLVDVAAGHSLPRERPTDGGRERLDGVLTARLAAGEDVALVGPAGSGKSTVCRQVACRWHDEDRGTVWYRSAGRGRAFASTGELAAALRRDPGHSLVVVEDAIRPGASAVFETMLAFRDDPTVSVLVEARAEEWSDPPAALRPRLETFRHESVALEPMPALDDRERERFVEHVASRIDRPAADLAAAVREADAAPDDDGPAALLAFVHRLAAFADPGAVGESALDADAAATLERLREAGDAAYDAGVLVNLLNAAGVGVEAAYPYALVADPTAHDPAAVDDAVAALHGSVLFGDSPLSGRTVHPEWSVAFLEAMTETEPDPAARRRVGRVVSAFCSLADDEAVRESVRRALGAEAAVLDAIAADPTGWADDTVERLFSLGIHQPGLAPLFGESDRSAIDRPAACSPVAVARCADWRAQSRFERGDYDVVVREAATLYDRAGDVAGEEGVRLRVAALDHRAWAALRTGDYDDAEAFCEWALALAERLPADSEARADAERRVLSARGVAAWLDGDLDAAEDHLRAAQHRADPARDPGGAAKVQNNLGIVSYEHGEFDDALERFERSYDLRRRAGERLRLVDSLVNIGVIERDRGDRAAALERFERAVELARLAGARNYLAHALRAQGNTLAALGRADAAVGPLAEALDLVRETGNTEGVAHCHRGLGVAARVRGDLVDADDHLERAREAAAEVDADRALALALRELGTLARERGDPATALDRLDDALAAFDDGTHNAETARTHRERGEALLALGDRAAAREAFETAREQYRALGAEPLATDCGDRLDAVAD